MTTFHAFLFYKKGGFIRDSGPLPSFVQTHKNLEVSYISVLKVISAQTKVFNTMMLSWGFTSKMNILNI